MRWLPMLVLSLCAAGCAGPSGGGDAPTSAGERRAEVAIEVGQPWDAARRAAEQAGYVLHDVGQLAWNSTIDGFYIKLPDGRDDLIVFRDGDRDAVARLVVVENASMAKSFRSN